MMEKNNRKGPGIFYAVMGVATLVVAIIGATFAFFAASAEAEGDDITGGTNNELAEALTLTVTRVNKNPTTAASIDLVPADIDGSKVATVNAAVAANCENAGYTGCHLYEIVATSSQTVANASVILSSLTVDATTETNWEYSIYTGTRTSATTIVNYGGIDLAKAVDMHNNAGLTKDVSVTYYLLVYLKNTETAQNENGETGTYTGEVTMNAAGGKVSATFSA